MSDSQNQNTPKCNCFDQALDALHISVLSIETGDTHAVLVLVVLVQLPEYAIPPKRRTSSLPISQGGSSNSIKNNAEKLPGLKSTRRSKDRDTFKLKQVQYHEPSLY